MTERLPRPKASPAPRKRALVSCDRCKLRRARCIRPNPDEPCSNCRSSGSSCESKLPRKQRVYGSVETLSLRFRALESLVKGLFPNEQVSDTDTLFKIAASRNIPMPDSDDYSPAPGAIFNDQKQEQPPNHPFSPEEYLPESRLHCQRNPFEEVRSTPPSETLMPNLHGESLYVGSSSNFKMTITIRRLVARCYASPTTKSLLRPSPSRDSAFDIVQSDRAGSPSLQKPSTGGFGESANHVSADMLRGRKRAKIESDRSPEKTPINEDIYMTLEDFLPSRSVADALVAAYFDEAHVCFPVFQMNFFQCSYDATFSHKNERLREKEESGWLCSLALVFVIGAQVLEKHDLEKAKEIKKKYLRFVRAGFWRVVNTTSLSSVQVLALMALYNHNVGKRTNADVLLATAARMAISMGLHRERLNAEFETVERTTRRIVWWSIYTFERILSNIHGRPSCIDDAEVSVQYESATMLENESVFPEFTKHGYGICKLSYEVRIKAYRQHGSNQDQTPSIAQAKAILKELDDWYGALPAHLRSEGPLPNAQKKAVLVFQNYYLYTRSIITRDYLIQKVERRVSRLEPHQPSRTSEDFDSEEALALAEDCLDSACQSLRCLSAANELGFLSGVLRLDALYVHHATLIICAARSKDHLDSQKDMERKAAVGRVLGSTQQKYLAPAYNVLSKMAFQFAEITGVTDGVHPPPLTTAETDLYPTGPYPTPVAVEDQTYGMVDPTRHWFDNETTYTPWNFFDMSMQNSTVPVHDPLAYSGYFMDSTVDDLDDWTA
ncbi:hypothetical protein K458DRAFT_381464 [Lentithecium fluviatile CBS 122367]|uniref:Zn(2)-C6 fungal-type domain-containing protein n=1 Tax=Lentithecium fluviatile CBS 122367 TaxID=1168545 RepID=A0A6G1JMG0_9PLEO|nr:hypothetical protein K458DRAFT_381464 [Lentithecium fluviatile CBS 122367]